MRATAVLRLFRQVLAIGLLLFSSVYAQAQTTPTIIIVGDSLSAGYGIDLKAGWVQLLRERMAADKATSHYQIINASVSGETTQGALARLDKLLATHQPQIVIVELGGNDGLRGQPVKLMRQNLAEIIKKSQAASAKVLLAGMQIPPNYGTRYTQMFSDTYPALAKRFDVALVPFFLQDVALNPALMQGDDIHPNAEAQPTLLENVWPVLQPIL
jgi:acyl-CoA thioesterase-1